MTLTATLLLIACVTVVEEAICSLGDTPEWSLVLVLVGFIRWCGRSRADGLTQRPEGTLWQMR